MDKHLLKDGIKEIVAQKGRLLYDTYKDIIGLYLAQRKQKRPTYYIAAMLNELHQEVVNGN